MRKNWPDGVKMCVALTFDLDAETFWFSRSMDTMHNPNLMAEGAYGPRVGVPRILDMLDRQKIKSTFFIPGWVIENHTEVCKEIVRRGHEIGYHGYLHEKAYFPEQDRELVQKSKKIMKDLLGVEPVGYRAPEAELTSDTIKNIIDSGFEYSSNSMAYDWPFYQEDDTGRKIIELPFNWLYDDTSHFFFTLSQPERRRICSPQYVRDIWQSEFDGLYDEGNFMNLVMHPQVMGRVSRVNMLEGLVEYMKAKEGVFIGTCLEISRLAKDGLGDV